MKTSRFILPIVASLAVLTPLHSQDAAPQGLPPEPKHRENAGPGGRDRERDERMANMKREIEQLRRNGKQEEAERRIRELREQMAREGGRDGGSGDDGRKESAEKIGHIMQAVGHLRAVGMDELADRLEKQARQMREALEQEQDRGRRERGDFKELRQQIQRLTQEVEKLREEVKRSQGAGPRTQ